MNRFDLTKFVDIWGFVDRSLTQPTLGDRGISNATTREDEVIETLASNGGYMWQGELATSLGWSAAKSSRVLSSMEAEGRVTRYRIGRRKAVCLPHREPATLTQRPGRA